MKFGTAGDGVSQNAQAPGQASQAESVSQHNQAELERIGATTAESGNKDTSDSADNGPAQTQNRLDQSQNLEIPEESQVYQPLPEDEGKTTRLNVEGGNERSELDQEFANQAAADSGMGAEDEVVVYSSHPIQNLHLGPYHFENTVLKLKPSQVEDFEALLDSLPLSESRQIAKLSMSKVDEIVQARIHGTKQFDSSVGRDALERLQKANPLVGTQKLGDDPQPAVHANLSQTDNNLELPAPKQG